MRFCPFCSAENADELAVCQACGRRLPPLPPRRPSGKGPSTGVQLPPRAAGSTIPPPIPAAARKITGTTIPPPTPQQAVGAPDRGSVPPTDDNRRQLANAIAPGPAAARRDAAVDEPRIIADRRRQDSKPPPMSATALARPAASSRPPPIAEAPDPPPPIAAPPPAFPRPGSSFGTEIDTLPTAAPMIETRAAATTGFAQPARSEAIVDRPFTPPKVLPVPEIPEPGLVNAARYASQFARARWQRRGAIRQLGVEIKQDTEALDQVLGALGGAARGARVAGRVFSAENAAISAAEERIAQLGRDVGEVEGRRAEENSKFVDVERERNEKLNEAERMIEEAQRELSSLEAQRRSVRDKRKELERRLKTYLKTADDHERQSGATAMGEQRQELRLAAEGHRREAAALEPDRQEIDRHLASLERPIGEATAKLDAAKAELDAAKRSLNDAREGHTHRLAELDSEQKRKAREVALAESEIARRLVTLGTLVNLNRIEDPQFAELYDRIDRLRGAITARTTEIERLSAEREAFDRGTLVRGVATIGGAFLALIALIVILRAIL